MNKKNRLKLLLDSVMIIVLVLMYNHNALGMTFHEVGGLLLIGVFVIHVLLNGKWVTGVTRKLFDRSLPLRTRISYILNILLALSFLAIGITGIFISKVVFRFNISSATINWKSLHIGFSAFSLVFIGLHIGLHYQYIIGVLRKILPLPKKIGITIQIVLLTLFIGYGTYSFYSVDFLGMLGRPFISQQSHGDFEPSENETPPLDNVEASSSGRGRAEHNGGFVTAIKTVIDYVSITMLFAYIIMIIETLMLRKKRAMSPY